jgi:hypothetical protein
MADLDSANVPSDDANVPSDDANVPSDDALAAAEAVAEREAAAETAADPTNVTAEAPKVVRPRTRTSGRADGPERASPSAANEETAHVPQVGGGLVSASSPRAIPLSGEVGGFVSLGGSGAAVVNARTVDVRQGGIGRVQAVDVAVSQGGIGLARAERVSVEMGGIGLALANDVRVTQGGVNAILARDVRIEQAGVRTIVANNVRVEQRTGVFLMIARHVEGDVRTLLDWRGAIAFGAALGVVVSFFRRRR